MSATHVHDALGALEAVAGRPVWVIATRWSADHAVNLDEEAWWRIEDLLEFEAAPEIAVVLWGRGGQIGFADRWRRALAARHVRAYVAGVLNGAYTLTALLAQELRLWPGAGLGAHDLGRLGPGSPTLDVDTLAFLPERLDWSDPELRRPALGLAQRRLERHVADQALGMLEGADGLRASLTVGRLGSELALGAAELAALGRDVALVEGEELRALGALRRALSEHLSLRARPAPRFTEAALGEEVEFELAAEEPGALLLGRDRGFEYILDTGRPDPDTNLFDGEWREMLLV